MSKFQLLLLKQLLHTQDSLTAFTIRVQHLLKRSLQPVLLADRQFAHSFPAALQFIHLLLQPVSVGRAAPGQISHRALQGPNASGSLSQLLLEGLREREKKAKTNYFILLMRKDCEE